MRLHTALALLMTLLPCAAASAGDPVATVDARLARYTGDDVPGAALLVVKDGEPVLRRTVGLADVDAGTPVTPATNFRLASVSKQFTAASVLLLAQDGRLRLDDPVRRWLPALPASANGVTLHHLLSHTSGLPDYEDLMAADFADQVRDADVLCLLAGGTPCAADGRGGDGEGGSAGETGAADANTDARTAAFAADAASKPAAAQAADAEGRAAPTGQPFFAPGSAYRYSNTGYALLALVVEKASGRRYPEFLRERIFAPLGMDGSVAFVDGSNEVPDRAYGHSADGDSWRRTDQSTTSAVLGDGGIYSSIDDLARWDAALSDDRLLTDASRALAFAAHTTTPTGEADVDAYGYGWRLDGQGLQWHSGETIGFRNVILRWPAQGLTVVLLTNRNDPEPYTDARAIGEAFLRGAATR
ncbi:MAG TPA: serine hydrolase domain-containing protein [Luteimonas sp.]